MVFCGRWIGVDGKRTGRGLLCRLLLQCLLSRLRRSSGCGRTLSTVAIESVRLLVAILGASNRC